jgi:hypothetical protein
MTTFSTLGGRRARADIGGPAAPAPAAALVESAIPGPGAPPCFTEEEDWRWQY